MAKMTHAEWSAKHADQLVGWTMLDEYQGATAPEIRFQHSCGHIKVCTPHRFLTTKGGCPNKECIEEKKKKNNLEKYGVENVMQIQEVKERGWQTNLERYGVKHPGQNSEIRKKIEQTTLERYGVSCSFSSSEVRKKIEQTNLDRYGYANPASSPEVKKKIKQNNLNKYGYESVMQVPEIKEKNNKTKLGNLSCSEIGKLLHRRETLQEGLVQLAEKLGRLPFVFEIIEEAGYTTNAVLYNDLHLGKYKDYYQISSSNAEQIAKKFFEENQIQFEQEKTFPDLKDIAALRFDFYLPEFNLLLELDGEFHDQPILGEENLESQQKRDEMKNEYCRQAGISLIRFSAAEMGSRRENLLDLLESLIIDLEERD